MTSKVTAILALSVWLFCASLYGADNKAIISSLQAQSSAQTATIRELRSQLADAQAVVKAQPPGAALATRRHNEAMAGEAATSANIRAVIAMDFDIRQLLMNSEEARLAREDRRLKQTADAVLAARLQVGVACSIVLIFALLALILAAVRRGARKP